MYHEKRLKKHELMITIALEVNMANLQVRDMDDRLYDWLRQRSKLNNRSISQEVISMIEEYSCRRRDTICANAVEEFLNNTPLFDDERSAEEICNDIASARKNSDRFENGIFD